MTKQRKVERADLDERLRRAVNRGSEVSIKRLLSEGADPSARGEKEGLGALILAARGGHVRCAMILLEAGADPNAKGRRGERALKPGT